MGLDTFATRSAGDIDLTKEDIFAFRKEDIELAEFNLYLDSASFDGEVYNFLVDQITGVSLYTEIIPPDKVEEMWRSFEKVNPYDVPVRIFWTPSQNVEAIKQLKKFFKVCAERKLGLYASF